MRMAVLLALVFLAGCSNPGPAGPSDEGPEMPGGHDAADGLPAPEWQIGDYWTLESPQQAGGPFTHAVSADAGDDWVVDTDSPNTAYFDARFDISFLGKVRKSDLAGSQGSTRVQFLQFPLQLNQTWSTTWDGEPMSIRVLDVRDGRATLQADRANGTRYAEYVYDSRPGYFSRFAFYDPDGSQVGFEWVLRQSGSNFQGTLLRWTLDELFASTGPIPLGTYAMFQVPAGLTDIWMDVRLDCQAGAVALAVGPPNGPVDDRGYSAIGPCPLQDQAAYSLVPTAEPEQWGAALTGDPMTTGTLDLHVFGRIATEFPVGQAPP